MDVMTLVYNERLNLNISCLKLAVHSPGQFAGTLAGIVFIWRLAILVDSLDTHLTLERFGRWHRAHSSFGLFESVNCRQTHR